MKKYMIFNDEICKIMLDEDARCDWKEKLGLEIKAQATHKDPIISIFEITDETKAYKYMNHPKVKVVDEKQIKNIEKQLFADYPEFILKDPNALLADMQISGLTAADIKGFDKNKPLTDQQNLRALYNANLAGIVKRPKPKAT